MFTRLTSHAVQCASALRSPLIMGNDLRNVSASSKAILLNKDAIGLPNPPTQLSPFSTTQQHVALASAPRPTDCA